MKLTHKYFLNLNHKQKLIIDDLIFHVSKLYNIVNYDMLNNKHRSYFKNEKLFKSNWHNAYLHSHNRQQILKKLDKDWQSFFNATKQFKKNPTKFLGKPQPPKYKNVNNRPAEVIFTKHGFSQTFNKKKNKDSDYLILSLSRDMKSKFGVKSLNLRLSKKVLKLLEDLENINQITLKKDKYNNYYLNIVFEKEIKETKNNKNIMAIDLGLDNLATLSFLKNKETYILDGKALKSKRKYFDKEVKHYQSIRMKQTKSKHFKDTKKIKKLRKALSDYKHNYLHQMSNKIVGLALKNNVKTIVVGDMKNIKQHMHYNKSFVLNPIQKLKRYIEYKAKLQGINYTEIAENYTSGCSALELEPLNKDYYNKSRRIVRGLFKAESITINSDVNGSLNILRKYLKQKKNKCIPRLINLAMANGYVDNPKRIRVA